MHEWLSIRLGTDQLVIEPMSGATSSHLYRITLGDSDLPDGYVLRCFLAERWEEPTATLSVRETEILQQIQHTTIPGPDSIACHGENGVLMRLLPGRVILPEYPGSNWLEELARVLVAIHRTDSKLPYDYASWNDVIGDPAPAWWNDTDLWDQAQASLTEAPEQQTVLLHRDYHPVNVLWEKNRISGVVDWINACMGPAGVDVAHCRCNLALMYDLKAADGFLSAYMDQAPGYQHHPFWDLDTALDCLPDLVPYAPWETFGLKPLSVEAVRARMTDFVRHVLRQASA